MKGKGRIEEMSEDGYGLLGKKPIYVPYTVVGDLVEVRKTRRRFGRHLATDFELLEESRLRQRPRCMHFGKCACLWQHIKYKEQLKIKQKTFEKITGINAEIKGSPQVWNFRNASNFIITTQGIGFKEFGKWWSIVDVKECPIFSNRTREYLSALKAFMREEKIEPWDVKAKRGILHYLSIREGKFTGEVMVNLIAHSEKVPESFEDYFSFADSIYWSFKTDERDDPRGEPRLVKGKEYIQEKIGNVVYLIHPNSFFQTNSYALPALLKAVEDFTDGEKVFDLYAGVGTFGVYLAKRGFDVEGVEINPFAVEMANKNAELNDVDALFRVGNAEEVKLESYDTIIVDPPRKGLKEGAKLLAKSRAERIVYVSCNPRAFLKDFEALSERYKIEKAVLIDMFPHTPHVEAVIELVKKS
ncbi:hypothetical protein PAP_05825 [Palaeococcus pacificus DY20341]|uniref:SAM-dependent methyltransferase n=1 Tax=Palaeococcus pacificus DY20341 TaxID=1343739 RepID=A0A075LS23_9EURY|nr:23S rRNA (uracil(1939)-C(5))-methyltransferase RlmD [Palaeococcus pacificus]AIF69565.1 hypothetical protein PAP_05825 [Palaeococcus pacificus DY20341]